MVARIPKKAKAKPRGRPAKPLPTIDSTPEAAAQAILSLPPDHKWQYPEKQSRSH